MKIDAILCPLETSNNFETTEFKIDDSAYAFELLIKRLYKDPITSIVREVTSNAWDSHVAANNTTTPVNILFPTTLDSHFTVEDQGTGLSPDQIENLYTVLFRSNRRDSNDFLGGYGLGSKSPLSYTDQFTVISRWRSFEFHYAVFTNEQGKPAITLLSQTNTDQPNGVTIRIPVSTEDFNAFKNAGRQVLKFFPNVKTNIDIDIPEILWSHDDVAITKIPGHHGGALYAVIGNVAYKCNTENLFKEQKTKIPAYYNWKGDLLIHFPIGSLTIVPNREDLSYDTKTINALEMAYEAAKCLAQNDVIHGIAQCTNYNEACRKYTKLHAVMESLQWWDHKTMCHPSKPGEPITNYIELTLDDYSIGFLEVTRRGKSPKIKHWVHDHVKLNIRKKHHIYWAPTGTRYLKERVAQISIYYWSEDTHLLIKGGDIDEITTRFNQELVQPCIVTDISHYYVEPKKQNVYRTGNFKISDGNTLKASELTDTDAYVLMDDNVDAKNKWSTWTIDNLRTTLGHFSNGPWMRVILLPKSKWSVAKKLDIPNFLDIIETEIPKLIAKHYAEIQKHLTINKRVDNTRIIDYCKTKSTAISKLTQFLNKYNIDSNIYKLVESARLLNIKIPDNPEMETEIKKIYETYKPFFAEDINIRTYPELLTAYDNYLEQQNNA